MNQDLVSYYKERANEYEKVYFNPAEQEDLLSATSIFQTLFFKKTVLEIACGTGYWTEQISKTAVSIHATDVNESVIHIAQKKGLDNNVTFSIADMYHFFPEKKFDGLFGGFIWSHILLQNLDKFLNNLKDFLIAGGTMVFIDSNPVEGTSHDSKNITKTDEQGNTYQARKLDNGTPHLVLKNFPTRDFLFKKLSGVATDINYINLGFYWIVSCKLA
jgi:2-polyprenyl-3-methyl-5-hydroxy-6-metoxy-1,4-benzoquinol methylase